MLPSASIEAGATLPREIALQMMDSTDCVDDGEVTEMACKLQKRVAGMTEEQAGSLARELLGKKAGVTEEQVHAWGAELVEMADTAEPMKSHTSSLLH